MIALWNFHLVNLTTSSHKVFRDMRVTEVNLSNKPGSTGLSYAFNLVFAIGITIQFNVHTNVSCYEILFSYFMLKKSYIKTKMPFSVLNSECVFLECEHDNSDIDK